MIARTLTGRWLCSLVCIMPLAAGCQLAGRHAEKHVPHYGIVDPNQPKELEMVSMPPYVVEPPDELEITVKPAVADFTLTSAVVQADGNLDLGYPGDVYVAGLTLSQIELKIAQHLQAYSAAQGTNPPPNLAVSVRLNNGSQSKSFYVLGTVSNQGKFPITGNETVLDGILIAGLRSNSLPEKAYLARPRPKGAGDLILQIDWIGIKERGDTLTNYQLFPGDRIIVPGGKAPGLLSSLLGGG